MANKLKKIKQGSNCCDTTKGKHILFYKSKDGVVTAWVESEVDFLTSPRKNNQTRQQEKEKPRISYKPSQKKSLTKCALGKDFGWPDKVRQRI